MQQPIKTSWWKSNRKWVVPGGCLTSLLACAGFLFLILTIVGGAIKSSTPYTEATTRARANPAVVAALGTPISEGFMPSGSVKTSGSGGTAELSIPISGPKGSGTLRVEARQSANIWTYSVLQVEITDSGQIINLTR